jgi:hypothetical protein
MADHTNYRPDDPDRAGYDDDVASDARRTHYAFGRSRSDYYASGDSMPLFLSDPDGEPDPQEFGFAPQPHRATRVSSRILMAVLAASAVAMMFALFSSDATRDLIVNAKASIATAIPVPSASATPSDATQLTTNDMQAKDPQTKDPQGKDPSRVAGPGIPAVTPTRGVQFSSVAPSREDITNAYQSAVQTRPAVVASAPPAAVAPAATPVAPMAAAPVRRLDPDELAMLMKRAKGLLDAGDIPPARLLLERAADAGDAGAAMMLARTYDPDVLGKQDARNINVDPALARSWYQRAAQLGSAEAQRRLAQLQN